MSQLQIDICNDLLHNPLILIIFNSKLIKIYTTINVVPLDCEIAKYRNYGRQIKARKL